MKKQRATKQRSSLKQHKRKAKTAKYMYVLEHYTSNKTSHNPVAHLCSIRMQLVEERENATAAKWKGFIIAMKTKAITNSVIKWAERATRKVQSRVEWIKTGGKNNKEAIQKEQINKIETISGTKCTQETMDE